LISMTQFG